MNIKMKHVGIAIALMALPALALASTASGYGTGISESAFNSFAATILGWLKGGLGIGIALVALIVGAAMGISNGTAMPMITGLIIAAGFAFLPTVLDTMILEADAALLPMAHVSGLVSPLLAG